MRLHLSCHLQCLLSYLLVHSSIYCFASGRKRQLYIGGMFPMSSTSGNSVNGSELVSVCKLALEIVNNRSDILPNYNLNLIYNDTKCDKGTGTRILIEYLMRTPPVIMLLGAGCSSVSRTVAQAAWQWNLVQVSYGSSASDLSNDKRYPLFYRVLPPDFARIAALISFLKYNGWQRIAVIAEDTQFDEVFSEMTQELVSNNLTIIVSEKISADPKKHLDTIKEKDARIIIALVNQEMAQQVFCQAYKIGLYGPQYAWLLPFWYGSQWWLKDSVYCNKQQLTHVARGNFFIDSVGLVTDNYKGVSGKSPLEIKTVLRKDLSSSSSYFALFAFDAVWAMALALHTTAEKLIKRNITLDMFDYNDKHIADIIQASIKGLSFQGTTGRIEFNNQGDRVLPIKIYQLQKDDLVAVAEYDSVNGKLLHNNTIIWQGSRPLDGQRYKYEILYISWPLFWCIVALTSCAITLALIFLVFNVVHRNKSYIKLSSSNINNVILIGAIVLYTSVLLVLIDSRIVQANKLPYMCSITAFFLGIGYSLFVGAMFSKTWRVYQLLNKVYTKRKVFTDKQLVALVIIFIVIDIFLFTLWTALHPFVLSLQTANHSKQSITTIIYQYQYCNSQHMTTWFYVILGYKVLILLVGCFIAMATRKVNAKALNDSQLIGASIYVTTIAAFIGIPLNFVIADKNAVVVVLCFTIVLTTTVSLCIIFIPKMTKVRKIVQEIYQLKSPADMRRDYDCNNQSKDMSNADVNATIKRLQIGLDNVKEELREKKSINTADVDSEDMNGYRESVDGGTPTSTRKTFTSRSNTFQDLSESPKLQPANQHRRYNTISVPSKQGVVPPFELTKDDTNHRDLRIENASLRRKLHKTKINEAGKMCKVLYENAELNRKIVELNMSQSSGHDNTETLSRLIKENNELKRQLGEVSILNSVCDTTPRMKRKGSEKNKRDLKELQHLLTVDLGGGRASSLRNKRPPTIGQSAHSFDPKETSNESVVKDAGRELDALWLNNNKGENTKAQENDMKKHSDSLTDTNKIHEGITENKPDSKQHTEKADKANEESTGQQDNQGFLDDHESTQATKPVDINLQKSEGSEMSREQTNSSTVPPHEKVTQAVLEKTHYEYEQSKTKELLEKGSVEITPKNIIPTIENKDDDNISSVSKSEDGPSLPEEGRTVIGSDTNDSSHFLSSKMADHPEERNNGECGINRKQRKSKRDKKTKIEKVEKTFFV